ncbi:MAG: hypothetical protein JNG82_12980 [Opitutaceae bacterium]|nr:hypothetical protein [Opitutaceae bacterium]
MTQRTLKSIYQVRGKRHHRPAKPEYAVTGIMVGIAIGWIVGFGLELVYRKKATLMAATSVAGLLLGAGFEAIRFRWRMHCYHANKQPKARSIL